MRRVICCGCESLFDLDQTSMYRGKRFCGDQDCKDVIDFKVKHSNYKKKIRKIQNGTFRSGVTPETRQYILDRDSYCCGKCKSSYSDDKMMQVHHIVPVSDGGSDDLTNLITVCRNCHKKIHSDDWKKYAPSLQKIADQMESKV